MPIARELAAAGLANGIASAALNFNDVVKIRLQTQRAPVYPPGFFATLARIHAEEGLRGVLLPGIVPSLLREFSYSAIRMGMYSTVFRVFSDAAGSDAFAVRFAAATVTGAVGSTLANPTDLVKIRQQAEAGRVGADGLLVTGLRKGHPLQYPNGLTAFATVARQEGFAALYTGYKICAVRASILTGTQLSVYTQCKRELRRRELMDEGFPAHVVSSVAAAVAVTIASTPADIIKSRMMAAPDLYTSIPDCFRKTLADGGVVGFYRGWPANLLRYGPHFVLSLPILEVLRRMLGLEPM